MTTYLGVTCPHCKKELVVDFCDGHSNLVSYWGDGDVVQMYCPNDDCEKEISVREYVVRTWEVVDSESKEEAVQSVPLEEEHKP